MPAATQAQPATDSYDYILVLGPANWEFHSVNLWDASGMDSHPQRSSEKSSKADRLLCYRITDNPCLNNASWIMQMLAPFNLPSGRGLLYLSPRMTPCMRESVQTTLCNLGVQNVECTDSTTPVSRALIKGLGSQNTDPKVLIDFQLMKLVVLSSRVFPFQNIHWLPHVHQPFINGLRNLGFTSVCMETLLRLYSHIRREGFHRSLKIGAKILELEKLAGALSTHASSELLSNLASLIQDQPESTLVTSNPCRIAGTKKTMRFPLHLLNPV